MIAIDKIVAAAVSVLCMTCASCAQKDEIIKEYVPSWWKGEYAVLIENATSGIMKKTVCANVCNFVSSDKGVSV